MEMWWSFGVNRQAFAGRESRAIVHRDIFL